MSARDFPPECPVFRVLDDGYLCNAGALVEGIDWDESSRDPETRIMVSSISFIGCRVLTEQHLTIHGQRRRHPTEGWAGATFHMSTLWPLTPAAREWLAYAKERAA